MVFKKPVGTGDLLTIYCKLLKKGNTSISLDIIAKVKKNNTDEVYEVTRG